MKSIKILEMFWQKSRNSRYLLREKEIAVLYYILNQFDKEGWPESVTVCPVEIAKQLVDYSGYIGGYLNNLERAGLIIGGGYTLSLPRFEEEQQGVESQGEGVAGSHKEVETAADVEVQVVQEVQEVQVVQAIEETEVVIVAEAIEAAEVIPQRKLPKSRQPSISNKKQLRILVSNISNQPASNAVSRVSNSRFISSSNVLNRPPPLIRMHSKASER